MRRFIHTCVLLGLLAGVASAQLTRDWTKRTSLPDSGNNILVTTARFNPIQFGQQEALYSLSSVTMLDGRIVFQVLKRNRNGDVLWSRLGAITTGNQKVWAKDMKVDVDGNVVVLAEIKQRADYDVMLYRFAADGTAGAKTLIRDKWQDDSWNIHDIDERAIEVQVNEAGEAFVLLSEVGNPKFGKYGSIYKINTAGSVMWNKDYRNNPTDELIGEVKNWPKAMDIDASGNVYILSQLNLDEQLDNFGVVSFDTNGTIRSNVTFGYFTVSGTTTTFYEDTPVDITVDGAGGVYVVGTTTFYENRGGVPYAVAAEFTGRVNGNTLQWGYIDLQRDSFFRPGQFMPKAVVRSSTGAALTVGAVEPYGQRTNAYVRSFAATGGAPTFNFVGPQGVINAATTDATGNIFATGAQYFKTSTGWTNKGVMFMLSSAGSVLFTSNQSLSTVNPGTQGVSVHVNGAGDVFLGAREYALQADGTTTYATVSNYKFVQDPVVSQMTITPAAVGGGGSFTLHVELSKRALAGGFKFKLEADRAGVALPAEFTVPAGEDEWEFTVSTTAVSSTRTVVLAVLPAKTVTAPITIYSGWITSLTVNKTELLGGTSLTATVTLNAPAPSGGIRVDLTADPATSVVLPRDNVITVPAGATQRSFSVGTRAVGSVSEAFIGATFNSTARAKIRILPAELTGFTVPATIQGGTYGTGSLTISGRAPAGGLPIAITTDSDALAGLTAVVPEGQTTVSFRLNSLPVNTDSPVKLVAKSSTVTLGANCTVLAPALKMISMDPATVSGGTTAYLLIELTGIAPSGGVVVSVSSSSSSATVSSSVTIAAGKKTIRVPVKTSAVSSETNANISVTYRGVIQSTSLSITPGT